MSSGTRAGGEKVRLGGPDAVRAVATVGVVAIHAVHWPATPTPSEAAFWNGADTLTRFAVPVFVILSGALLQRGYATRPRGLPFLRRRFLRSVVPWAVWAPFYMVVGMTLTTDIRAGHGRSLAQALADWWLYGGGHLWFLLVIPQLYLVFAVWPRRRLWLWGLAALAVQTGLDVLRLYLPMERDGPLGQVFLWHSFQLFPWWIGYFGLGVALADLLGRRLRRPGAVAAIAAVATVVTGWMLLAIDFSHAPHGALLDGTRSFLDPVLWLFSLSIVLLVNTVGEPLRAHPRWAWWARRVSEWSLGVYIVHPFLLNTFVGRMMGPLLGPGLPMTLLGVALLVAVTTALSCVAVRLIEATPLALTVGLSRRPLRHQGGVVPASA